MYINFFSSTDALCARLTYSNRHECVMVDTYSDGTSERIITAFPFNSYQKSGPHSKTGAFKAAFGFAEGRTNEINNRKGAK